MSAPTTEKTHTPRSAIFDTLECIQITPAFGSGGSLLTAVSGAMQASGASNFIAGNGLYGMVVLPYSCKIYGASIFIQNVSGTCNVTGMNVVVGTGAYVTGASGTTDITDPYGYPPVYAPLGTALWMSSATPPIVTDLPLTATGFLSNPSGTGPGSYPGAVSGAGYGKALTWGAAMGSGTFNVATTIQDAVYQKGSLLTCRVTSSAACAGIMQISLLVKPYDGTPYTPSENNRPFQYSDVG
jgi:hypothetical protein